MTDKITPRVWNARRFVGNGYDMYGKQSDGKYYCSLQEAINLEKELIAANKEIKKLRKQLSKYD